MKDLNAEILDRRFSDNCAVSLKVFDKIQSMSTQDMETTAFYVASIFPKDEFVTARPAMSHTPYALFIRHLFMVKHKNGALLDQAHPDRIKQYEENCSVSSQWEKSFEFCDALLKEFDNIKSLYGQVILLEVLAHRFGDLALLSENRELHIQKMEECYMQSYDKAKKMGCSKQVFTPWYWGACYFSKLGEPEKASAWFMEFHKKADNMGSRSSYVNKASLSFRLLRQNTSDSIFKNHVKWLKRHSKSGAIRKALKAI